MIIDIDSSEQDTHASKLWTQECYKTSPVHHFQQYWIDHWTFARSKWPWPPWESTYDLWYLANPGLTLVTLRLNASPCKGVITLNDPQVYTYIWKMGNILQRHVNISWSSNKQMGKSWSKKPVREKREMQFQKPVTGERHTSEYGSQEWWDEAWRRSRVQCRRQVLGESSLFASLTSSPWDCQVTLWSIVAGWRRSLIWWFFGHSIWPDLPEGMIASARVKRPRGKNTHLFHHEIVLLTTSSSRSSSNHVTIA